MNKIVDKIYFEVFELRHRTDPWVAIYLYDCEVAGSMLSRIHWYPQDNEILTHINTGWSGFKDFCFKNKCKDSVILDVVQELSKLIVDENTGFNQIIEEDPRLITKYICYYKQLHKEIDIIPREYRHIYLNDFLLKNYNKVLRI